MATVKKDTQGSSAEAQRASSTRAPGKTGEKARDDKAVREAADFYTRAVSRPDVRAILEDLAKV